MTDNQILELAKQHLEVLISDGDELDSPTDFAATKEQLIAFAKAIYEQGFGDGNEEGWEENEHYWTVVNPQSD
jgi:hypothetical protein